ncbi:MAG: STAS/SEC14 domain-containing protein [Leptospirales bacterium]|nr:STAS/SEC14 domain-containing protein [Leptospirales bacterium]
MPYTVTYLNEWQVVQIAYEGEVSPADLEAALYQAAALAQEHGTEKFLADCSLMEGGHSVTDLFSTVHSLDEAKISHQMKEAIVFDPASTMAQYISFYETAAMNRGYNVRLFSDRSAALAWLKD